jgi:hypothetical protein
VPENVPEKPEIYETEYACGYCDATMVPTRCDKFDVDGTVIEEDYPCLHCPNCGNVGNYEDYNE